MRKKRQVTVCIVLFLVLIVALLRSPARLLKGEDGLSAGNTSALQGIIALHVDSPLALVNNRQVVLDPANQLVTPLQVEGEVLVPLRFIAENLGWKVYWQAEQQRVVISNETQELRITLGENRLWLNGQERPLESAAVKYLDRTYIPLKAVSEAFGKKVVLEQGLVLIADQDKDLEQSRKLWEQVRAGINKLPAVGSAENMQKLLAQMADSSSIIRYRNGEIVEKQAALKQNVNVNDSASVDYSQTNIQVQGVDEADLLKTDGKYLYQISGRKVVISRIYPTDTMKVVTVLEQSEGDFNPTELYVDQDNLVVIGYSNNNFYHRDAAVSSKMIYPPVWRENKVKAVIYDLRDKDNITKVRELELDGNYLSSRKIGSYLYLVANRPIYYYGQEPAILPSYRDSVLGEEKEIPYNELRCIPPVQTQNYLIVAGLDLSKPEAEAQVSAYLGAGDNIYVSEKHLYVAVTRYPYYQVYPELTNKLTSGSPSEQTLVYKFALAEGQITYLNKGEVPGRILNQFSMDEYQDNFRITTTVGYSWGLGEETSQNNLYILDKGLSIIGRLENIAPGEQIYSTRFMGERAYMVTFKTVDPLFVLDLKDPYNPQILGTLKIPGYSDYLHPYDANHIIGFGKDTVEVPYKDRQGRVLGTNAYYLGMKIAVFDVSDVANPRELFTEKIGDRGTTSELLYNHKALLFNREKELLAFPVTLLEITDGSKYGAETGIPEYGRFTFQGAYIYKLNLTEGFTLRGRITHLSPQDYQKAGYSSGDPAKEINRILYIDDVLYTVSDTQIKANDLGSLAHIKDLPLP